MNLSEESFLSPNLIVSEIAKRSGDAGFDYEPEAYYLSLVQEALQELSFDTLFLEREKTYKLEDGCLKLTLPSGAFNVLDIIGHGGDECNRTNSTPIWYKRNYRNGQSRDNWGNRNDIFHKRRGLQNPPGDIYFCGIANGVVHLSPSCGIFPMVTVRFNGLLADVGDKPLVPSFFKMAVLDYCIVEALSIRIAETNDDKMVSKWQFILGRHEMRKEKPYTGSWENARYRVKRMDSKTQEDYKEYFARLDY